MSSSHTGSLPVQSAALLRVVIADDHAGFRSGLRASLATFPDVQVVGEAQDGLEAVALSAEHEPDLVLIDLKMPRLDGLSATRRILKARPETRVLVLTMSRDSESVNAALAAGARGYLLKGVPRNELIDAARAVVRGHMIIGADVGIPPDDRDKTDHLY